MLIVNSPLIFKEYQRKEREQEVKIQHNKKRIWKRNIKIRHITIYLNPLQVHKMNTRIC